MIEIDVVQRFRGSLLGLATGDALGASVEGFPPGSFHPVHEMQGGGPHQLAPGEWTDDTAMALCLAESLIQVRGFDPVDQMERYLRWLRKGHLSSTGEAFDVGMTVSAALRRYESTGIAYSGPTDQRSAGNGSLMRLAPVALLYWKQPEKALEHAANSSRTTHGAPAAIDACRLLALLLVKAVEGCQKEELLDDHLWNHGTLVPEIEKIARGSYKFRDPPEIRGTGYVVQSLEAALWAFHRTNDYQEGCLRAVNLGDDADTTAAVFGQLAGAHYGEEAIPLHWRRSLAKHADIEDMGESLYTLSLYDPA